jgi:hypothetical protein
MNKYLIGAVILVIVFIFSIYKYKDIGENLAQSGDINPLPSDFLSMRPQMVSLPMQEVSKEEKEGLIFMREEEKLARDVYITLYEKWGVQIFSNISQSEQTHTEAVRSIMDKYAIEDPVASDSVGEFVNTDLKKLYLDLTKKGLTSLEEAFTVGAIIEDLDIADLERFILKTDNEDIKFVYENLMRGSRNHLRSFVSQLTSRGSSYEPKYITIQDYKSIISSPRETGFGGIGGRGWGNR